jgi:hypothetical protein
MGRHFFSITEEPTLSAIRIPCTISHRGSFLPLKAREIDAGEIDASTASIR